MTSEHFFASRNDEKWWLRKPEWKFREENAEQFESICVVHDLLDCGTAPWC